MRGRAARVPVPANPTKSMMFTRMKPISGDFGGVIRVVDRGGTGPKIGRTGGWQVLNVQKYRVFFFEQLAGHSSRNPRPTGAALVKNPPECQRPTVV